MNLREALKQKALGIGFDLVGIAPPTPGDDLEFARTWVERGSGGEMHYLSNPKRFDPRAVLPSVKSVICVGLIYDTPLPYSTEVSQTEASRPDHVGDNQGPKTKDQGPARESACAWISRYAWGRDYHEIVREKLERLRAAIEELAPGVETRVYVDTGPVVERAFARFSGVGWMGKNTCIINEQKGSWFFIGVILANLELEPELPAPDRCGTCRACLDACPTGALVEPYVMDASRCISYLTIELKGSIPRELRPGIGVNIFGCDICQDVCPWNSRQSSVVTRQLEIFQPIVVSEMKLETGNSKLTSSQLSAGSSPQSDDLNPTILNHQLSGPRSQPPEPRTFSLFSPPLESLAAMTEDEFRTTFAHSPIKRTRYRGWLRNLCVAMGNSDDARFVPKLRELSQHRDPFVREHAEWAIDRLRKS